MHCYKSYHQTSIFNFKLVTDCSYFCMNLNGNFEKMSYRPQNPGIHSHLLQKGLR